MKLHIGLKTSALVASAIETPGKSRSQSLLPVMLRPDSHSATSSKLTFFSNSSSVRPKQYITLRNLQRNPSLLNPHSRACYCVAKAHGLDLENSIASINSDTFPVKKAGALASVSTANASSQPAGSNYQPWWAPHQQVALNKYILKAESVKFHEIRTSVLQVIRLCAFCAISKEKESSFLLVQATQDVKSVTSILDIC